MRRIFVWSGALVVGLWWAGCSSSSSEQCDPGAAMQGGTCVVVDGGTGGTASTGDAGSTDDAGSTGITCGAGTTLVGHECVAVDAGPATTCGAGTALVGGKCVPVDAGAGVTCGAGTMLVGGQCVPFEAGAPVAVVVSVVGPGNGTVMGPGLTCAGSTCSTTVPAGTAVQLTATAGTGYVFVGWNGGGCSGAGTCQITAGADTTIKAGFAGATYYGGLYNGIFTAPLSAGGTSNAVVSQSENYAVSPDGMTFAYNYEGAAWVKDYWSGTSSAIASNLRGPSPFYSAFSPDGTKLALWVQPGSVTNLETIHADGTGATAITSYTTNYLVGDECHNAGCATTRFVAWSPDGTQLAWVSTAPVPADGGTAYANIWTSHADGTGLVSLTSFTTSSVSADPGVVGIDWSPDGSKIAFVSTQSPAGAGDAGPGPAVSNLWTLDVTSKALTCVTNFAAEYYLDMATYARSGNTLVFSATKDPAGTTALNTRNLFSVKDDGTGFAALTSYTSNSFNQGQYWAPDGTTLVYESNQSATDATKTVAGSAIWAVKPGSSAAPAALTPSADGAYDFSPLDDND